MTNICPYCRKTNKNTHSKNTVYTYRDEKRRTVYIRPIDLCDRCYSRLRKREGGIETFLSAAKGDIGVKRRWEFRKVENFEFLNIDGNDSCPYEWTEEEVTEWNGEKYRRYPHGKGMEKYFHYFGTKWGGNQWVYYLHRDVWENAHREDYPYGVPKGHVIHHKDHNILNNDISNLQLMTDKEHRILHGLDTE